MLRRIVDNFSTLLVALLLAVLIWVVASYQANPFEERLLTEPLLVEITNLPPALVLVSKSLTYTVPTLRAPRQAWEGLGSRPVRVFADLSGLTAGEHSVQLTAQMENNTEVRVVQLAPAFINVTLETLVTQTIPILLEQTGVPALGYAAETPILSTQVMTLTGPASAVAQAWHSVVRLSVENARRDVFSSLALTPLDLQGKAINGLVTIEPTTVLITIPIVQKQGFRDVAVKVVITGQVASGYQVTNYTVLPQFITLASADPTLVSQMPGFVETQVLDISNATDDVVQRLTLNLPAGVEAVGEQNVLVQVNIAAIAYSLTIERAIEIQGLAPGLGVQVSPDKVSVLLFGPLPLLDKLQTADVRVIIHLDNLPAGTYQITPEVVLLSDQLRAENLLPNQVEVVIAPATPTPTPTPTQSVTATATKRP